MRRASRRKDGAYDRIGYPFPRARALLRGRLCRGEGESAQLILLPAQNLKHVKTAIAELPRNKAGQTIPSTAITLIPVGYIYCKEPVYRVPGERTGWRPDPLLAYTKEMDAELLCAAGVSTSLFEKIVFPGTVVGSLTDSLSKETGVGSIPVIAVAGHDTASAVAAVPTTDRNFAYLSSGTWSLMGIETEEPIISEESYQENFTNEGGIDGTIRFLKNITGMWLLERCREEWKREGKDYSYAELIALMEKEAPFRSLVNPNAACFANPQNMQDAIFQFCRDSNQPEPETAGQYVRCIFESLAFSYRKVLTFLKQVAPFPIHRLHVIGGGAKNDFLNQLVADVIQLPVVAGPSEATAVGNGLMQARAAGLVCDRWEMRRFILSSLSPQIFVPQNGFETYKDAYQKFLSLTSK